LTPAPLPTRAGRTDHICWGTIFPRGGHSDRRGRVGGRALVPGSTLRPGGGAEMGPIVPTPWREEARSR
jgi:hypothetical protein